MKNIIILVSVAIILVGVVVFLYSGDTIEAPTPTPIPTPTVEEVSESSPQVFPTTTPSISTVTVTYSDSGYSSSTVTIKRGDTVVFEDKSSRMMWTASAVHPTHKAYPGSDIAKCGISEQSGIFDACKAYGSGESWEFRFNEQGTWKYHNHLQPNHTGTIIVE